MRADRTPDRLMRSREWPARFSPEREIVLRSVPCSSAWPWTSTRTSRLATISSTLVGADCVSSKA